MLDHLFDQGVLLFTIPALLGTAMFLLKMSLMLLGGDADVEADVDLDVHAPGDGGDSTHAFTVFSIQALGALLMGFGWGGLASHLGFEWSMGTSIVMGTAFGAALVWLLGILMKAAFDLRSSGNISISQAVGREGVVYAAVPRKDEGRGQVRVVIDDRERIYNAVSADDPLPSRKRVRVLGVTGENALVVIAVE